MDEQLQDGIGNEEISEDKSIKETNETSKKINDEEDEHVEESLENASKQTEEPIPEALQPNNEEQIKEKDSGINENLKVADALMGGNILNKQRIQKDSHFINKP